MPTSVGEAAIPVLTAAVLTTAPFDQTAKCCGIPMFTTTKLYGSFVVFLAVASARSAVQSCGPA